jgi:hypothetical protein
MTNVQMTRQEKEWINPSQRFAADMRVAISGEQHFYYLCEV